MHRTREGERRAASLPFGAAALPEIVLVSCVADSTAARPAAFVGNLAPRDLVRARGDEACEDRFLSADLGLLSSSRSPQTALKCCYSSDSMTRDGPMALRVDAGTDRDAGFAAGRALLTWHICAQSVST